MIHCGIKCGEAAAVISHHCSGVKMKSQTAGEFPPTRRLCESIKKDECLTNSRGGSEALSSPGLI